MCLLYRALSTALCDDLYWVKDCVCLALVLTPELFTHDFQLPILS